MARTSFNIRLLVRRDHGLTGCIDMGDNEVLLCNKRLIGFCQHIIYIDVPLEEENVLHIAENIYLANLSKNEWRVIPCKNVFSFYIYISVVKRIIDLSHQLL